MQANHTHHPDFSNLEHQNVAHKSASETYCKISQQQEHKSAEIIGIVSNKCWENSQKWILPQILARLTSQQLEIWKIDLVTK